MFRSLTNSSSSLIIGINLNSILRMSNLTPLVVVQLPPSTSTSSTTSSTILPPSTGTPVIGTGTGIGITGNNKKSSSNNNNKKNKKKSTTSLLPPPPSPFTSSSTASSSINKYGRTISATTTTINQTGRNGGVGGIEVNPLRVLQQSTTFIPSTSSSSTNTVKMMTKRGISNFASRTALNSISSASTSVMDEEKKGGEVGSRHRQEEVEERVLEIKTIPSDSDGGLKLSLPIHSSQSTRTNFLNQLQGEGVEMGVERIKVVVPNTRLEIDLGTTTTTTQKKKRNSKSKSKGEGGGDKENVALLKSISENGEGEGGGGGKVNLSKEIEKLYELQKATPASLHARSQLIEELIQILNQESFRFGHPHTLPLSIEPFGSVRFGLSTSTSDLDLCLFDPYRPDGFKAKFFRSKDKEVRHLPDIYDMRKLGRVLMREGFEKVVPITGAGVPIVKFEAVVNGERIMVDINTNERLGVLNSKLIDTYCNLNPLVRPLSVFIKFWAKQRRLNDPAGNIGQTTFSSYTLILMVITYLQHIKLLPNLQDEELIDSNRVEKRFFWSKPKPKFKGRGHHYVGFTTSVGWDVTFIQDLKIGQDWIDRNSTSTSSSSSTGEKEGEGERGVEKDLKELARGFFEYFSSGKEFNFNTMIVSIKKGKPIIRSQPFMDPFTIPNAFELLSPPPLPTTTTTNSTSNSLNSSKPSTSTLPKSTTASRLTTNPPPDPEFNLNPNSDLSLAEIFRQESEDEALLAMAESEPYQPTSSSTYDYPSGPNSNSNLNSNGDKNGEEMMMTETRASSPEEYGDFVEPKLWCGNCIVVQDPFLIERNTAGNIESGVMEILINEMSRALNLINLNAPLSEICNHVTLEAPFQAHLSSQKAELKARQLKRTTELKRAEEKKREKLKLKVPERRQLSNSEVLEGIERDLKEVDREMEREKRKGGGEKLKDGN